MAAMLRRSHARLRSVLCRSLLLALCLLHGVHCLSRGDPLTSVDPVRVGHERAFENAPGGRPQGMRTLSEDPPIFLLPGFLSKQEAQDIVSKTTGWASSAVQGDDTYKWLQELDAIDKEEMLLESLPQYDDNGDKALDELELANFTRNVLNLLDHDHLGFVKRALGETASASSPVPLSTIGAEGLLIDHCLELVKSKPHLRMRHSKHAWFRLASRFGSIFYDRLSLVTGLPKSILVQSREQLQVVHYPANGHYSCHHDGGRDFPERLLTVGVFLNDVEDGGHTVFPAVGADTAPETWDQFFVNQCPGRCASKSGLAIKPKRGDALLWYNMNPKRLKDVQAAKAGKRRAELAGESLLNTSAHCGSPVLKGEKYFANFWLTVPDGGFTLGSVKTEL